MYIDPGCGTTINYVFLMTRLKPGNLFRPFPPPFPLPFPPPQQRLMRTNLGLSILKEPGVTIWNQDELSQEEGVESGRQEESRPSDSKEVDESGVSQEEAGVSVSQEEAGVNFSLEVAGPSRSSIQSQVPPLRLHTKRPRKGTVTEEASLRLMREATNFFQEPHGT
ncbi:hypothetical protein AB205_0060580 [Aquarana catesbeiana]|uniref:Uncharacterized protein n=1 Tax=Aquarana catesbeiana TaxID=8400 RepID=A0A2G9Q4C3_AQUCT|nr:hypothetical protein AB205_0060580 [Aquarana catesbeiana]